MRLYQQGQDHNDASCYELFRRAVIQQDQEAWRALYDQFFALVCFWLSGFSGETDVLANHAFGHFAEKMTPERFDRAAGLGQLLNFFKCSAQNLAIDLERKEARRRVAEEAFVQERALSNFNMRRSHQRALDEIKKESLYDRVRQGLKNEKECLVFQASIEWDMPPRDIADYWPDHFDDALVVSRIKERIFRRLSRDPQLRWMLGLDDQDTDNGE
jgi:hypothetical protein